MKILVWCFISVMLSTSAFSQSEDPSLTVRQYDLRFDHSTILVTDLDRSAVFYGEILHLEELDTPWGENPTIRFFSVGGNRQLHMARIDSGCEPERVTHLAFAVENFDDYLVFLQEKEIRYGNFSGSREEPQLRPDGVRQIYLQDPDGNWIEINDAGH